MGIEWYKEKLISVIKEANEDGIEIQPYAERTADTGEVDYSQASRHN